MNAKLVLFTVCIGMGLASSSSVAQLAGSRVPGGCDVPVSARSSEIGCYLVATEVLQELPSADLFWHLYNYPSRAAAESAKPKLFGTVAESVGKVWLYVIAGAEWRPKGGERIAVIGPLRIKRGAKYAARYMEATFSPGMQTSVHTHSGPEAWYIVSGKQCLQTPEGHSITRAGEGAVVPMGPPMVLTSLGTETRRSVVLVLHDTSQPWMTITAKWKPTTPCPLE